MRLFCAVLLTLLVTPAFAVPDEHKDVPADLAKAAIAYDNAQLEKDGAALNQLLANDYRLVARGGVILDKAKFVAHSVDPDFKLLPLTIEHGNPTSQFLLFADVWAKRGGVWRVFYTQVSAAKN